MSNRRVSVLIATYNRPSELNSCLRAIEMNASQIDVEVCVVNDGGPSIRPIIQQFPKLNIHFEDLPVNKGQVYCRNLAFQMATGDWISICDDDDRFLPNHLSQLYETAKTQGCDIPFLFSDIELVVQRISGNVKELILRRNFAWKNADELLMRYNPIAPSSVLYHRNLHRSIGLFDESVGHYWDWDFWLRSRPFAKFVRIPMCTVLYGMDADGSNQSSEPETMRESLNKLIEKHGLSALPSSNFYRMTEDPLLVQYKATSRVLWDGDMRIWM